MAQTSTGRVGVVCLGVAGLALACARSPKPAAVTPAEMPALEARAQQHPADAAVRFQLGAGYLAAGRCDAAAASAGDGLRLEPGNVLGPLVIGACQERDQRYDLAVETYRDFTARFPKARGVAAIRAKEQAALRRGAEMTARQALARETEMSALPPEPSTLAVLPLTVAGDTAYNALSRGLAELITTDLATIRSLRLLERLHVGALLDELRLAQAGPADSATAARVGRMLRAERLVQGVATIPSAQAPVRLQASVVAGDGSVRSGTPFTGAFSQLLDLEKQVVLDLGAQLGIQLTAAERQRILEQGPKNLAAFLAYSEGLEALDRGDFGSAARHFGEAARADPSFQAAHDARDASEVAPLVDRAGAGGDVVALAAAVERGAPPPPVAPRMDQALTRALRAAGADIAPTLGDAVRQPTSSGTDATQRQETAEVSGIPNLQGTSAIIRIIFRRPL